MGRKILFMRHKRIQNAQKTTRRKVNGMDEVKIIEGTQDNLTVALSGDIHAGNAEEFYNLVAVAYDQSPKNILFDGKNLNFIDSTTLGVFVKILKKAKADGYGVRLQCLQQKIKKLFLICSLDTIMEID